MAVSAEGFSVIVRNRTLEERFPGGVDGYRKLCPNRTFCTDLQIARIGFMNQEDAEEFIARLGTFGLAVPQDNVARDIALCNSMFGLRYACDWLETGTIKGRACARLTGDDISNFFIPEFELDSKMRAYSKRDLRESFDFLGTDENNVEHYRNKATGELIYVGRTCTPPAPPPRKWWQFWKS